MKIFRRSRNIQREGIVREYHRALDDGLTGKAANIIIANPDINWVLVNGIRALEHLDAAHA